MSIHQISGERSLRGKDDKCDFLKIITSSIWKKYPNLKDKKQIAKKFAGAMKVNVNS